jgi:hypothetical protein
MADDPVDAIVGTGKSMWRAVKRFFDPAHGTAAPAIGTPIPGAPLGGWTYKPSGAAMGPAVVIETKKEEPVKMEAPEKQKKGSLKKTNQLAYVLLKNAASLAHTGSARRRRHAKMRKDPSTMKKDDPIRTLRSEEEGAKGSASATDPAWIAEMRKRSRRTKQTGLAKK